MPGTDMSLEKLIAYQGTTQEPDDFWEFWERAWKQVQPLGDTLVLERRKSSQREMEFWNVTIRGLDGLELKGKFIHPVNISHTPLVVQFHDFPGGSRSWMHLSRYAAIGYSVLAMDCRGQGGLSNSPYVQKGITAYGPLFHGLSGKPEEMYLYKLYTDALTAVSAAKKLPGIDPEQLICYGEGQGAALALACAAFEPSVTKCGLHYPCLCDYRRVWDMDFDKGYYEGLRYYFRWKDSLNEKGDETFAKLDYMDGVNFASYAKTSVLMSICLQDLVSPPSCQFAVYNHLNCPKIDKIYPKHGHELNNFFENEWLKFLLTSTF
ncbi:acetylxylan esterase [Ruminococcus sp. 5_1_39BFAA]|uniref:acetylxylan esterase n=1 Tax=Ruminococcus sp. 5_1_39BFAA TaxID=457412 RepID=UPI003562243E